MSPVHLTNAATLRHQQLRLIDNTIPKSCQHAIQHFQVTVQETEKPPELVAPSAAFRLSLCRRHVYRVWAFLAPGKG